MKLGPVTKLDKRNKTVPKKLTMMSYRKIVTPVCKSYIFINSNLLSYKK